MLYTNNGDSSIVEDIKNFFNIIFFLVIGIIAILSYLQARKTLFSPIKTEIFKIQMEEFKSVLAFFNKRSSSDFDTEFGFDEILNINAIEMQQAYINTFFEDKVKPTDEFLEKLRSSSYGMIVSKEYAEENFIEIKAGNESDLVKSEDKAISDPAIKLAKWQEYKKGSVVFTKKFHEKMEELEKIAASPLLPKELTDLIYEFTSVINGNLGQVGEAITKSSQLMPVKYPTPEAIMKFNPGWIWNAFNDDRKNTEKSSAKILKYINEHLKINELMK